MVCAAVPGVGGISVVGVVGGDDVGWSWLRGCSG